MKLLESFQDFIQSAKISQQPFGAMAYGANPKLKKKKVSRRQIRRTRRNHGATAFGLTN